MFVATFSTTILLAVSLGILISRPGSQRAGTFAAWSALAFSVAHGLGVSFYLSQV